MQGVFEVLPCFAKEIWGHDLDQTPQTSSLLEVMYVRWDVYQKRVTPGATDG